ncbi:MAG TPA: type 4a pilus biogenesis protein PilO [Pirellulales bacterium]|jgi:Tfp pilus assembly protein PilO|nr:type 4a pilus biogenesis protein PilO [Pirellulales bacterium]
MKMQSPRGNWLVTLPMAGIAAAFVLLIFLPGQRRIHALREEMREKQDSILAAGQTAARIHALKAELTEARQYNAQWRGRTASSAGATALCGQIAQLAQASGVTTTRFAPAAPTVIERLRRVPLTVACHGSFAQIQAFLAAVEERPRRVWLEDLKLSGVEEHGDSVQCELVLAAFVDNFEESD